MSLPRIVDIREETTLREEGCEEGLAEVDEGELSSSIFEKVGVVCEEIKKKLRYLLIEQRRASKGGALLLFWENGELPPPGFDIDDKRVVRVGCDLVWTDDRVMIGSYEHVCNIEGQRCMLIFLI